MKKALLVAAIAVGLGFTVHRSFRNGYPAEWKVSKTEAELMRPLGQRSVRLGGTQTVDSRGMRVIEGRVTRVSDGDTIHVTDASNMKYKIRMLDIDAPESSQTFGAESAKRLQELIAGKPVRVTYTERDQYGRVLGTVWAGDVNVNLQMVAEGCAWAYHYTKNAQFLAAQRQAKAARNGLWANPDAQDPWAYRKAAKGTPPDRGIASAPSGRKEYHAGNGPMSQRVAAPVNDDWPDTGYWLSTNSNKRHNRHCDNYRKTRGYPCKKGDGTPCGKCGG